MFNCLALLKNPPEGPPRGAVVPYNKKAFMVDSTHTQSKKKKTEEIEGEGGNTSTVDTNTIYKSRHM
jgi:hypothetical protein